MTPTPAPGAPDIRDDALRRIKLEFLEARERGDSLSQWLARYPEHARELIDLAMSLDAERRLPAPGEAELASTRAVLSRALAEVTGLASPQPALGLVARIRALGLKIPDLARRLQLTADLLFKLDRGYIRLETVPRRLLIQLAGALRCPVEALVAGLPRSPVAAGAAAFYSHRRPQEARQQSFAEALAQSPGLSPAARNHWLAAVREEESGG